MGVLKAMRGFVAVVDREGFTAAGRREGPLPKRLACIAVDDQDVALLGRDTATAGARAGSPAAAGATGWART